MLVGRCLVLLAHSKKVLVRIHHLVRACVVCGFSSATLASSHSGVRLIGDSKLPIGVSVVWMVVCLTGNLSR